MEVSVKTNVARRSLSVAITTRRIRLGTSTQFYGDSGSPSFASCSCDATDCLAVTSNIDRLRFDAVAATHSSHGVEIHLHYQRKECVMNADDLRWLLQTI